jgi:hypothetical protein
VYLPAKFYVAPLGAAQHLLNTPKGVKETHLIDHAVEGHDRVRDALDLAHELRTGNDH